MSIQQLEHMQKHQVDIMYQDNDVTILHPKSDRGIIIWTNYVQPDSSPDIYETGLKTGEQLKKEGIEFGRSVYHPYIFFRAPYRKPDKADPNNVESYYDKDLFNSSKNKIFIRVDPDKTNTYSSEIRVYMPPNRYHSTVYNNHLKQSRKTLTEYLDIITENKEHLQNKKQDETAVYNLYTSRIQSIHKTRSPFIEHFDNHKNYPLNTLPINRMSEILVRLPHLTPNYFVMN